jgi:hypothetical protein
MLKRNTEALGSRVTCLEGGLWDRPARLNIINHDTGATAFLLKSMTLIKRTGSAPTPFNKFANF